MMWSLEMRAVERPACKGRRKKSTSSLPEGDDAQIDLHMVAGIKKEGVSGRFHWPAISETCSCLMQSLFAAICCSSHAGRFSAAKFFDLHGDDNQPD